jgi:CRISPR-associated protein (TIGR03984 family)
VSETLYRNAATGVSLTEALGVLGDDSAVGLFIAPGWCRFGQLKAGLVTFVVRAPQPELSELDPRETNVYEARVFNKIAEVRWWNDPGGQEHRAAVISEQPIAPDGWPMPETLTITGRISQSYLLWGRRGGTPERLMAAGWTSLTTARIGSLDVPIASTEREKRFEIYATEYLKVFADGNVGVVEERLLGIRPCNTPRETKP